jgi:hypothetical protein
MSFPHYDLVERAHSELLAEGKITARTVQEDVEQDKGLLTRRAGYYVNSERDASIGLLEKTEGNNSLGYSVDLLLRVNGTFWDVATDQAGLAQQLNGGPSGPDPTLAPRWRQPAATAAARGSRTMKRSRSRSVTPVTRSTPRAAPRSTPA